jgi:predicted amidohydrolase
MIVAGLQMDIAWENPEENFRRAARMAEAVCGEGAGGLEEDRRDAAREVDAPGPKERPRLIVLPEMFATGFSMNSELMAGYAAQTRAFLASLAKRLSVFVLGGYAEPGEPLPANACSIFAPSGDEILHFQKLHPFSLAKEEKHYRGGDGMATATLEGVRVTPLICYDLRFPEPFRAVAHHTDLFCVIANWPAKRREAWSTLLKARAIENQAYLLGVNRVGVGGGEPHSGDSALLGPQGEQMSVAPLRGAEGIVLGRVNPDEVRGVRRRYTFLKDRRPGLYRRLEGEGSGEDQP